MSSPKVPTTWWRRLSVGTPDDVDPERYKALRRRGFTKSEAQTALSEHRDDFDAAFHYAIQLRHKTHTGSPYLYRGCELCDDDKEKIEQQRARNRERRNSAYSDDGLNAIKAHAVEAWRERNAAYVSSHPLSSPEAGSSDHDHDPSNNCKSRCIKWICPTESFQEWAACHAWSSRDCAQRNGDTQEEGEQGRAE